MVVVLRGATVDRVVGKSTTSDKNEQRRQSKGAKKKKKLRKKRTLLRSATRFDSGVCFSSARRAISTRTAWRGGGTFQFVCCSFL